MKKRFLSLLCVLALCLGLLPATALAATPNGQVIYVGNENVTSGGYWTTDSDGNVTASTVGETPTDNYISYDAENNVLTLHNATIKNELEFNESIEGGTFISGSAIGVFNKSGNAELTISLVGTNTIANVGKGIFVLASSASTGSSNLTIQGDGSLNASASQTGIWVQSNGNNAALCVENAEVTASADGAVKNGVLVQAKDGSDVSLTVNGGSLTASVNANIWFQFGSGASGSGTPTVTVSNNAIVRANGGIANNSSTSIQYGTGNEENGGIVFDGSAGTVYGSVTLQDDLEIKSGETLTVPDGSKLDCNNNLTNKGTILVETGGTVSGNLSGGTAVTTPSISQQPTGQTVTEGTQATFSVTANDAQSYQWQQSTDSGNNWTDISGATSASYTINSTTISMSGYQYRCVVKSASGVGVISSAATLTVTAKPAYTVTVNANPTEGGTVTVNSSTSPASVTAGSTVNLVATANEGYRFTGWTFSDNITDADSSSANTTFTMPAGDVTVTAQFAKVVTGVSLDKTSLSLYTGSTGTLTATVEPDDATNQNVTWQSDSADVATVEGGTVTAVGAGETTITVQTQDGNYTATCHVTVTQSTYSISADTTALNFGSVYTGYAQPAAKEVTITNTGNRPQTLTLTASTGSFEVGTLTKTQLAAGEKATFTVQPKAGLAVGTYSENITVSGTGGATVTITASFTVKQYSSGGSSSSTPSVSDQAIDKIEAAKDGSTVSIKLPVGRTTLEGEVFETLAGQDITLEISLSNGVTWTVNGQDIPKNAKLSDLDLGVTLDASTIPVNVINTITGTVDTIQLSLKHDGEFGFTMTLSAPLGKTNAGYWANLYYYNEETKALEFQAASRIASDGTAEFAFSHASDYAIVIDTDSHEPVELPFTDVPEGAWYEDAAAYVYKHGLMAGTSATTFAPDVTTSRAMIATILWRMAGSPVVNYAMTYTDVAQGQWYSEAVRWATSEGVVTGYGNGLFGTNDPITREQLATMLWRYAQTEDYDVSVGEDTNILSYTDAFDVAEYAIPAMQWAVGAGIINGTGDGSTLTPQGQATRAQAAMMLQRFCEEYVIW